MLESSKERPGLNVHVRGRGIVVDTTLKNPEPNRAFKRMLAEKEKGNPLLLRDVHNLQRRNGKSALAFSTKPDQDTRRYKIDYDESVRSLGGNGINVGIAYLNTLRAFDSTGTLAPETVFHSRVFNRQIEELLKGVIPPEQFHLSSRPDRTPRKVYWIPHEGDLLYLPVHTPHLQKEQDPLGGNADDAETHFISSTADQTPVWTDLIARVKRNPESHLVVMPGRNNVPPETEHELMQVTDLVTFNREEAERYLGRTNSNLLAEVKKGGPDNTGILAMAISITGPKRVLITNGPYAVALYERGMKEAIMVSPPAVASSRDIIRDKVKSIVISEMPIFTGCGDTLVGVFMALEKLTRMGIMELKKEEQLQLAVNISSFQAWNPASHIGALQPSDLQALADTNPVTKMAA